MIFDSLLQNTEPAQNYRREIYTNIIDYLNEEYKVKKNVKYDNFDFENLKMHVVQVPQQDNVNDCGLFLLQNFESFYKVITHFAIK